MFTAPNKQQQGAVPGQPQFNFSKSINQGAGGFKGPEPSGAFCGNCFVKPIEGIRYKCMICADFELCSKCEWQGVHAYHTMERLPWPFGFTPKVMMFGWNSAISDDKQKGVHESVSCDKCSMAPIRGKRYKCLVCSNFDTCEKCEDSGAHREHSMARIPLPETLELYQRLGNSQNNDALRVLAGIGAQLERLVNHLENSAVPPPPSNSGLFSGGIKSPPQ